MAIEDNRTSPSHRRPRRSGLELLLPEWILPSAVFLLTGIVLFPAAGLDDAYITYWPALTLLSRGQLLNYNGVRVEQSSSLMQVGLLATLARFSPTDISAIGRIAGVVIGAAIPALVWTLTRKINPNGAGSAALIAATSTYMVYWSFSGMETSIFALSVVGIVLAYGYCLACPRMSAHAWFVCGAAILVCSASRPEGALLCVGLALASIVLTRVTRASRKQTQSGGRDSLLGRSTLLLAIAVAIGSLLAAFRWAYFDGLVPQPVVAKFGGLGLEALVAGLRYVREHAFADLPTSVASAVAGVAVALSLIGVFRDGWINPYRSLCALAAVGYSAFIIMAGGDWMPRGRFLVPLAPLAAALTGSFAHDVLRSRVARRGLLLIVLISQGTSTMAFAARVSTSVPVWGMVNLAPVAKKEELSWFEAGNRVHARDLATAAVLGDVVSQLAPKIGRPLRVMTGQMGLVPYHVSRAAIGDVEWIDRNGLTDDAFSDCGVTSGFPHHAIGLGVDYNFFFAHLSELERDCGIGHPDAIFDLDPKIDRRAIVEANGYAVVFWQTGWVESRNVGDWLYGSRVSANEFIAVRGDLLSELREDWPVELVFP